MLGPGEPSKPPPGDASTSGCQVDSLDQDLAGRAVADYRRAVPGVDVLDRPGQVGRPPPKSR